MKNFLKYLFLIIWTLWCLLGIAKNHANYGVADWIAIILLTLIPYFIIWFINHKSRKKENAIKENTATLVPTTESLPTPLESSTCTNPPNGTESVIITPESPSPSTSCIENEEPQNVQYIESGNTIYRTDGKSITDEEIPYLMQLGYEKVLEETGTYNGQLLDLSYMQERDKNKKEYTRIPTYQELSTVETKESYVSLAEVLFLNYLHGLPIINPLIAQKWYYDYNLNYTKVIKNLISNELLTVEHVCIDKLSNDELKAILRKNNYPTTGKKAELISRIYTNISQSDIDNYFDHAKYFSATPKGKDLIKRYNLT